MLDSIYRIFVFFLASGANHLVRWSICLSLVVVLVACGEKNTQMENKKIHSILFSGSEDKPSYEIMKQRLHAAIIQKCAKDGTLSRKCIQDFLTEIGMKSKIISSIQVLSEKSPTDSAMKRNLVDIEIFAVSIKSGAPSNIISKVYIQVNIPVNIQDSLNESDLNIIIHYDGL